MDLSPKQFKTYHESNHRINILEGSVRSGKSHVALVRFIKELRKGPPGAYLMVGKSERTVLHNIIEPMNHMCGGIIKYNRGLGEFTLWDKKVYVVGANDERAEGKIRGLTAAGALVDEATLIPQNFFKMLLSRLSVEGAKLFCTTNPDSPYHWLKTDFIDRADDLDLRSFKFTLEDNPSLGKAYVEALKKEYTGIWHKRFILGEWCLAEGSVFDFFDQKIHVVRNPPTYAKQYFLGVDYGTTNPFAAVLIGYNEDHHPALWVEKEYYWDSKKTGYQLTDMEYELALKREFGGYPVTAVYLDPAAASFNVELRRGKWQVLQADNSVLDGIRFVSNQFISGELVVCSACVNLIQEIESYVWDEKSSKRDGEDKPVKLRDHAVDGLRYGIFTKFGKRLSLKNTPTMTAEQRKYAQNPGAYPGFSSSQGWQRF